MTIDPRDTIVDDGTELPMPDGTQAGADLDFGAVEGSGLTGSLDQTVTLTLGELLPDSNGEIVIVNGGDDPQLQIVTDLKLLESGVAHDLCIGKINVARVNSEHKNDDRKMVGWCGARSGRSLSASGGDGRPARRSRRRSFNGRGLYQTPIAA